MLVPGAPSPVIRQCSPSYYYTLYWKCWSPLFKIAIQIQIVTITKYFNAFIPSTHVLDGLRAAKLHMIMKGCHATPDANYVHHVIPLILACSKILRLIQYKNHLVSVYSPLIRQIFWRCRPNAVDVRKIRSFESSLTNGFIDSGNSST